MYGYSAGMVEFDRQEDALNEFTVDVLKKLAALVTKSVPTRKADIISSIVNGMAGAQLKKIYDGLSQLDKYVVAEALYAPSGVFDRNRFEAKYCQEPTISEWYEFGRNGCKSELFAHWGSW